MRIMMAVVGLFLLASAPTQAQDRIDAEHLAKIARRLSAEANKAEGLPYKSDVDAEKGSGVKGGEIAAVFLPEKEFRESCLEKAGGDVTPVGQLWMLGLSPVVKGQPTPKDKLRMISIKSGEDEKMVSLYLVGVKKDADKKLVLVVYAQGKEPLLTVPLKEEKREQSEPVVLDGEKAHQDQGGISLHLAGKQVGTIRVVKIEP